MDYQSDASWIEELAKNNHAPSDEAVQEVTKLLLKPMRDLKDIEVEITDLRNRLSELESKRSKTQKWISRYESILAPIRRIPSDVLGEIFYRCLPTHRNPIMKSSDCPLLLTQVCSPWRTTAMSFPRLWERLYVTFTDDDTVPDVESAAEMAQDGQIISPGWRNAQQKSAKERTREVLRTRYEVVKEWVMRSGTRPLSISISFGSAYWYSVPHSERCGGATIEFLSFLATLAPRLKDLELKMSMDVYKVLERMVTVTEMTALTSLRAEFHDQTAAGSETSRRIMLLGAPNLRRVSMWTNDIKIWGIPDRTCKWNKLTSITYFASFPVAEFIFILENCSNLVHLKVAISNYTTVHEPVVYEGHISLPFLQTLSITEYVDPRYLGDIFDSMDAPALQWIEYTSHLYPDEVDRNNLAPMPIIRLLQKSTELQKLTIDANDFSMWDIGGILRAVPTITHLVMGLEERPQTSPYRTLSYISYQRFGTLDGSSWRFTDLIASDQDEFSVLPHLKSLVITSTAINISDEILFDVVKSRMVGALEHVSVVFSRQKEKDVEQQITRHAELIGVKINLELDYVQPPAPEMKPISPEFGLKGPGGRSWPYVDAGENQ